MDDMFASMFGMGAGGPPGRGGGGGGPPPRQRQKTQTRPSEVNYSISLEELYMGKDKSIAVERTRTCCTCKGCVQRFSLPSLGAEVLIFRGLG